jgi:hypothetical protein
MNDNAVETIIEAIREEIWANNQMQLAAFYANLLPPPSPASPAAARSEKFKKSLGSTLAIISLIFGVWCLLMWVALWKRSHQRGQEKKARKSL